MTCGRLIIISRGEITGDVQLEGGRAVSDQNGTNDQQVTSSTLSLEVAGAAADDILNAFTDIPNVLRVEQTEAGTNETLTFRLHYTPTTDIRAEVAEVIVGRGWQLLEMHTTEMSLEELFLSLTV